MKLKRLKILLSFFEIFFKKKIPSPFFKKKRKHLHGFKIIYLIIIHQKI